ncbi:MAG: FG-GAP-like repeat-containing protein [Gemmatimonadota bacterium]
MRLLRDAAAAAAADPDGPTFADYDSYLFIHAGLGYETGLLNDIRSVYLAPADLAAYGADSIAADGGRHWIRDAWILPEAIHRGGRAGLNGMLAKFFGHQLGLPGLSNFADGVPALGGWSLMDVGANRLGFLLAGGELVPGFGFVPCHPMAWSKARLGWIEPLAAQRDTVVTVVATDRSAAAYGGRPKAVRVPLSRTEYLLLENRQQRSASEAPPGVKVPYDDVELAWIGPEAVTFSRTVAAEESAGDSLLGRGAGVWAGVAEYDAFVPGSGILVWHVDDRVIAAAEAAGAIDNDRQRPGLRLIESDGSRDIGNFYFDRQNLTEGSRSDPFYAGLGPGGPGVSHLGAEGSPDTRTNTGLGTGVEIDVLSALGDTMTVRVRFRRAATGFPVPASAGRRVQAADLDGDGDAELLVEDAAGVRALLGTEAWSAPGDRFLAAGDGAGARVYTAGAAHVRAWQPGRDRDPDWTVPSAGMPDAALLADAVDGLGSGSVLALARASGVQVLEAGTGEEVVAIAGAYSVLALADLDGDGTPELVAAGPRGVDRIGAIGSGRLWESGAEAPAGMAAGDLDGDGRTELVVVSADGQVIAGRGDGTRVLGRASGAPLAGPSLGDLDGDGVLEIAVAAAGGVSVWRANGLAQAGFPASLPSQLELGDLVSGALLLDLDADGRQELLAAADQGLVGFDPEGRLLAGFPLVMAEAPVGMPAAADLDGDGELELAAVSAGLVHAWEPAAVRAAYAGTRADWAQAGRSAAGTQAYPGQPEVTIPVEAAGLLAPGRTYCYPNPVGSEDGQAHLRFWVTGPARAELQVFDAVGERVERLQGDAPAAGEHEIAWDAGDYASGLYLLHLKVQGPAGASGEAVVRMAVAR